MLQSPMEQGGKIVSFQIIWRLLFRAIWPHRHGPDSFLEANGWAIPFQMRQISGKKTAQCHFHAI
jgi:hypothetical protein